MRSALAVVTLIVVAGCPVKSTYNQLTDINSSTTPLGLIIRHGQINKCELEKISRWEIEVVVLWKKMGVCKKDPTLALKGKELICVDTEKTTAPDGRTVNGWATNLRASITAGTLIRTKSLFFHETSHIFYEYCREDVDHYLFQQFNVNNCGGSCKEGPEGQP